MYGGGVERNPKEGCGSEGCRCGGQEGRVLAGQGGGFAPAQFRARHKFEAENLLPNLPHMQKTEKTHQRLEDFSRASARKTCRK